MASLPPLAELEAPFTSLGAIDISPACLDGGLAHRLIRRGTFSEPILPPIHQHVDLLNCATTLRCRTVLPDSRGTGLLLVRRRGNHHCLLRGSVVACKVAHVVFCILCEFQDCSFVEF